MPRPTLLLLPLLALSAALAACAAAEEAPLLGFGGQAAVREHALEARFDAALNREDLREWMKRLTAQPHHVGSRAGKENAEWIAGQMRGWGYDTQIEEFQVLFPTPKSRLLEMTSPERFKARLEEPRLKEDATSGITEDNLPTYNAYSVDGDVTGPLVYVNYGVPKDYETLAERGIDVRGKIVIARYGGSWRGIKPKVAAEHGAVGCLIYSDPKDDGYAAGDVYPKGSFRNEHGVQRGSVADMPLYPGDPLTPGAGATKDAKRLDIKDAPTLTKIPVLPISYASALPLLKAMEGPVAPEEWRGALPITYHLGPGPATVHLKLTFNWNLVPAYDVIARMRGSERPDEWIIRGNHHDAWNFGAEDPVSGAVTVMEEARAVGELARGGWRPKRTILYALWDGEEPGLLGSTEWVETHAEELRKHAVAYLNSDNNGRGFLRAQGSHSLERFINEVARDVTDPQTKVSALERLRAQKIVRGTAEERKEARERTDLRIAALGSGSDYTPFLQHAGIASLDLRFGGEDEGGSYHSIYDSFDHYARFGDPGFDYCLALAQVGGRAVLRLAQADVLPFEFTHLQDTVDRYVKELVKLADDMREQTREKNRQIRERTLVLAADPKRTYVPPKPEEPVPYLDFAPLQNAVAHLQQAAHAYDAARAADRVPADRRAQLDALLIGTERALIRDEGLPRRPWFKHQLYAPGFYTGYGVKTIPGVREAIEQRRWSEADAQIKAAAGALDSLARRVGEAGRLCRQDK